MGLAHRLRFPPFQGGDPAAGAAKARSAFWPALQTNWRLWTPVQFINVNYVPVQVRLPARAGRRACALPLPFSVFRPLNNPCFLSAPPRFPTPPEPLRSGLGAKPVAGVRLRAFVKQTFIESLGLGRARVSRRRGLSAVTSEPFERLLGAAPPPQRLGRRAQPVVSTRRAALGGEHLPGWPGQADYGRAAKLSWALGILCRLPTPPTPTPRLAGHTPGALAYQQNVPTPRP